MVIINVSLAFPQVDVITAHTPHISINQVVMVLGTVETRSSREARTWGVVTIFSNTPCTLSNQQDPLGGTMYIRETIWWKEVKPFVLAKQYLLSKTIDGSTWTAIQRIQSCREQSQPQIKLSQFHWKSCWYIQSISQSSTLVITISSCSIEWQSQLSSALHKTECFSWQKAIFNIFRKIKMNLMWGSCGINLCVRC